MNINGTNKYTKYRNRVSLWLFCFYYLIPFYWRTMSGQNT
jgi:hypothetical protein